MGLREWVERKMEETRVKNQAKSDAMIEYYKSPEYRKDIAELEKQKIKENKPNGFASWLKKVSNNAAASLGSETVKFDIDKATGKKKE